MTPRQEDTRFQIEPRQEDSYFQPELHGDWQVQGRESIRTVAYEVARLPQARCPNNMHTLRLITLCIRNSPDDGGYAFGPRSYAFCMDCEDFVKKTKCVSCQEGVLLENIQHLQPLEIAQALRVATCTRCQESEA